MLGDFVLLWLAALLHDPVKARVTSVTFAVLLVVLVAMALV